MKTTWLASVVFMWMCSSCAEQAQHAAHTQDAGPDADASVAQLQDAGTGPCGGASCKGVCSEGRCLITLARSTAPVDLVVDTKRVYFTSCALDGSKGVVLSVPVEGGKAMTLASGSSCPTSLALASGTLYVTGLVPKQIVKLPASGGAAIEVAASAAPPVGLAIDASSVYWTTSDGALLKAALTTGAVTLLASKQASVTRPVVDAKYVYWGSISGGEINKLPLRGGAITRLASVDSVASLALAGDDVYFASGYTLMHVPASGGAARAIGTAAGAPVVAVAADDESVYFTSYGSVWKVARHAGASAQPVALATDQGEPSAIAVDATSVYWTNALAWPPPPDGGEGRVMKLSPK